MSELITIQSLEQWTHGRCVQHIACAKAAGLKTLVTAGYRTWAEQMEEYRKGRVATSGGWVVVDERLVRTRALPDRDPHCRRAAYDLWLLYGHAGEGHLRLATMDPKDGWSPAEIEQQITLWGALVRIGGELGLTCGAHWPKLKDWPHFENPDWRNLPVPINDTNQKEVA